MRSLERYLAGTRCPAFACESSRAIPASDDLMDRFSGTPWQTTAVEHVFEEGPGMPPVWQTLTAVYELEGPDEAAARELALAIFGAERRRTSLPKPDRVVAHGAESATKRA